MSIRRKEITIGVSYLLSTASAMTFFAVLGNATGAEDYLPHLAAAKQLVLLGVLANMVNCVCVMAIAISLYPVLEKWNMAAANTVLATRIIEVALLLVGCLSLLVLVEYSQQVTNSENQYLVANLLLLGNERAFDVAMVALSFGGVALASLLYQHQLVPRWISFFGLLGYPIMLVKSTLAILQYPVSDLLFLPGAVFEFAFPVWLLVRGFKNPAAA
jgi:hypothetical protein